MHVVAVMSQKGGAGKSTIALHLASEAATRGTKALLIDLDPQGNLKAWAKRRGDLPPDVAAIHPSALTDEIASAQADGYELVVLDTAPSADRTTLAASKAAHLILVPCRPAQFDLDAIEATLAACSGRRRPTVVVINAAPIRSRVVDEAAAAIRSDGTTVCPVIIRHRVAFQHCLIDGRTAGEFEPGGAGAQEITALYVDMLARLHADR